MVSFCPIFSLSFSSVDIVTTTTEDQDKKKIGQKDTTDPTVKIQGAPPQITVIDQGSTEEDKEEEKTPKEKEQEAIQTLVNLSTTGTPTK